MVASLVYYPACCAYWRFGNNKRETNQMTFDLSQYLPFNAFVAIGIIWMLAFVAMTSGNNSEGE